MEKQSKKSIFLNPLIKENAIIVSLLGMCPVLGVTTSINNALGMGVAVILVLFCTNTFISLIRKWVPNEVRIPCFIVIIACFVTMVEYLMKAFTPDLASSLGLFIPMITVNCIILGRAEAFASKNSVVDSMLDGLGTGIGFLISCLILAFFREVLGTGGITFLNPFTNEKVFSTLDVFPQLSKIAMPIFVQTSGAFIVFGIIVGIFYAIQITIAENKKEKEKKALEEKKKQEALLKAQEATIAKEAK